MVHPVEFQLRNPKQVGCVLVIITFLLHVAQNIVGIDGMAVSRTDPSKLSPRA